MEVQVISRQQSAHDQFGNGKKLIAITDYKLDEIIIRSDKARFIHYMHELIHGILSPTHTRQLKEALAWYFTSKLLKPYQNLKAAYPLWIHSMYISPMEQLAKIVGDDTLRELSVGNCCLINFKKLPK